MLQRLLSACNQHASMLLKVAVLSHLVPSLSALWTTDSIHVAASHSIDAEVLC